ncbi:unnamed protein product [Closterium sp. Yama58-4]|nr:unnamed protein product [Closterium sp. Yama58-4]
MRVLLYDYMPNGDLREFLYDELASRKSLQWPVRFRVAMGVARGLAFLHSGAGGMGGGPMAHGAVHPGNVLLDGRMEPKLADMGVARIAFDTDDVQVADEIMGYTPPEYSAGPTPPTPAGDVYSFGVVLLELLTARPPVDPAFTDNGTGDLIGWVRATMQAGQPGEALDPRMADAAESGDEMLQFLKVALVCVAEDADERPMMREVVEMMVRARETAAKIRENPQIRDLLE